MQDHIFDTSRGDTLINVPSPLVTGGLGGIQTVLGIATLNGVGDPGVSQDSSQGYTVGSIYFNSSAGALRWWVCRDATVGAAKWVFEGADYVNGGTNPATDVTAFGSGTALVAAEGNIYREVLAAAGRNPGATGADNVLAVYSMPLSSLDAAGRGVNILAQGSVANNVNVKRVKIYWGCTTAVIGSTVTGGTVIADTGNYSTTGAAGWSLEANVFKRGALNSNTQLAVHMSAQVGAVVGPLLSPSDVTAPENAAILIAITGNATTTATDIIYNFAEVNAMN